MTAVSEARHELTAGDGIRLHVRLAAPPNPIGALILCHGLTVNCDEFGAFPAVRDRALRSGLAVARFDFRCHGESEGTNEQLRLAGLRADADAVADLVAAELGDATALIPVGLSFGGAAAIHLAGTRPSAVGLCLWYAVVDYAWNYGAASPVPFTRRMWASRRGSDPAWAGLPIPGIDYYLPSGLLAETASDATPATLAGLTIPVLAFHGTRDAIVGVTPVRAIARVRPNITLTLVRGAGHGFRVWRPWVVRRTVEFAAACASSNAASASGSGLY